MYSTIAFFSKRGTFYVLHQDENEFKRLLDLSPTSNDDAGIGSDKVDYTSSAQGTAAKISLVGMKNLFIRMLTKYTTMTK